ncbi:UMP kinase [Rickettsiales bacterium]|nr:UMP kinase [Rickettsiales bacterium]
MKDFKRVMYKLSGEMLSDSSSIYEVHNIDRICSDIVNIINKGIELCIVVGGGNIMRGRSSSEYGITDIDADHMGMLGTIMNAIAIKNALITRFKVDAVVLSSIRVDKICDYYTVDKARKYIEEGKVVIFGAGIGSPCFSTDTAAAIRSVEVKCDVVLKGTNVDGIYSADPKKDMNAVLYEEVSYAQAIKNEFGFMDAAAMGILKKYKIPTIVFSANNTENPLTSLFNDELRFSIALP